MAYFERIKFIIYALASVHNSLFFGLGYLHTQTYARKTVTESEAKERK